MKIPRLPRGVIKPIVYITIVLIASWSGIALAPDFWTSFEMVYKL